MRKLISTVRNKAIQYREYSKRIGMELYRLIDKYGIVKKTISVGIVVNVYYCWDLWKSLLALDSVLSAVNKKNSDFFDKALQNRQTIIKELVSLDEQYTKLREELIQEYQQLSKLYKKGLYVTGL